MDRWSRMAHDRFLKLPEARQRAILRTAAEAFAQHGFEGASFNALLAELGLSKSQAYYYFEDKADLFVTAFAAAYEDYYQEVEKLPLPQNAEEFWRYVYELCRVGVSFQRDNPVASRLSRALARSALRDELARKSVNRAASTTERHRAWLELGQKLGAVRTDLPMDLLVSLSIGLAANTDLWFAERAETATDADLLWIAAKFANLSSRLFSADREQAAP